jgi:hypothetical protein
VNAACQSLADGVITRAASLMGDFAPLFYLIGGIALAMWVVSFVRSFVGGD